MVKKTLLIFLLLFFISSTEAFAIIHYFKSAAKAEQAGNYDKALSMYNKVLGKYPYETKSLLRAYDHILNIHKIKKQTALLNEVLGRLKNSYPDSSFDLKDFEKLSVIYSKYGEINEALKLQWNIVEADPSPIFIDTVLRTYSRLFAYYKDKSDKNSVSSLLNRLGSLSVDILDENDSYDYAMLILKNGSKEDAINILENIIYNSPQTTASRKAIFVLAEESQKSRDYDSAINYYAIYIERYPENTFYIQKAFQRMVDCFIAKGETNISEKTMKDIADYVNGISDYRSQLNLAEDLKQKNMDRLAEATFNTGYFEAKKLISENPGTYDALKAYLEIQRAAHALMKFDIVEQAAKASLNSFNNLAGDKEFNKNVSFIKSQAYLWLARVYREQEKTDDAINILEDFIKLYPEHKDKDYAVYELGRAYENKGAKEKAKGLYMQVNSEPLKNKAQERLTELK